MTQMIIVMATWHFGEGVIFDGGQIMMTEYIRT